jgi:lipopolysaccharide biosynthesis regulator YciM
VYRAAVIAGAATLVALFGAGLWYSLRGGRLPPLQLDYAHYLGAELKDGDRDAALAQMQLAADIDLENRGRVVPALAEVARRLRRPDVERAALLRLVDLSHANAATHARLAELALERAGGAGADGEALAEAEGHAGRALAAEPDSVAALVVSGRIALAQGDRTRAFETWNRAGAVDPATAQRVLSRLFTPDPELGYEFLVYRLNQE